MIGPFEFDADKNESNRHRHGMGLNAFTAFDADPAIVVDDRRDYAEVRYRAFGRIDGQGYMVAFTTRDAAIRLISFRRCHDKEMMRHGR